MQKSSLMKFPADSYGFRSLPTVKDGEFFVGDVQILTSVAGKDSEISVCDVQILTSGGLRIPAHSSVLASISLVLEKILDRPRKHPTSHKIIPILGVPCNAVVAFVRYLYYSSCSEEAMEKFGIHLLVLSHVFSIPPLKQTCTRGLAALLKAENVVDMLQLAKQCNAPYLTVKCMKLMTKDFKSVEKTEGWKFVQDNDPWLELELLQFLDEVELRKKRRIRNRKDQNTYLQLSEAMDCLQHICTEGCTGVGPYDKEQSTGKGPCNKFSTCQGLQLLIRHFASCKRRVPRGCSHCKRMWQLLQLHSSICDHAEACKVPLCRQFKLRMQLEKKGDDGRWRLLARKVVSAKAISSLSIRKMDEKFEKQLLRTR